jgi:hypothetical protein
MSGERELLDIWLTRRLTVDLLRSAILPHLPTGRQLVDIHDVWLGAPSLPALVVAADYRITVGPNGPPVVDLEAGAAALMAAAALPRRRAKGSGGVDYDLRPLLEEIAVGVGGSPIMLRIRTRMDPRLGPGRPSEVVAALEQLLGRSIPVESAIRERLVVAGEP